METRIISRTLSEDLMDLCTYDDDLISHSTILRSIFNVDKAPEINITLRSESNTLLLYKLEITRFPHHHRSKRSGWEGSTLQQKLSSNLYEQAYRDKRGLEISVKVPRGGKITTLKPNEGSEGTTTELWGEKEITEKSPLPILVTDKPLSECSALGSSPIR
ncbi:unnamed protein product [Arctia plantaginis]|uniref:Uncharacterized protein n=1 Tax=Arctia plantaginis TaxID=874455 RepID=A0A8S1B435_ARCPL|nr:unnamed protein product [Arctia plantaginis]